MYTFINPNTSNYIPLNSQNALLYTHKVAIKLVTFATNGTQIVFLEWKLNYMLFTWKDEHQNSHKLVVVYSQIWPTQEIVAKMFKCSCK